MGECNADAIIEIWVYEYEAVLWITKANDVQRWWKRKMKWKFIRTAQVHGIFDFRWGYYIFSIEIWNAQNARKEQGQWNEKQARALGVYNYNRQANIWLMYRDKLNIVNLLYAFSVHHSCVECGSFFFIRLERTVFPISHAGMYHP